MKCPENVMKSTLRPISFFFINQWIEFKFEMLNTYMLFTFLSVDMEILTLWSSQVHPEAQPKGVQATGGC